MGDYLLLMHDDVTDHALANNSKKWDAYMSMLRQSEHFSGSSSIKVRWSAKRSGTAKPPSGITGYIRVKAVNTVAAKLFLQGNPVYEAGGTVEICELTRD